MTLVMALDGVTSLSLKDVANTCKCMRNSKKTKIVGFLQCNGGKLEETEALKCVFVVYCTFESK